MNKTNFLKFLSKIQKYTHQGISLTEVLLALVITSIVMTFAAKGAINLLSFSESATSKSLAISTLNKALAFMQEEIKSSISVTQENGLVSGTACLSANVDSDECLVLTFPISYNTTLNSNCDSGKDKGKVYYGYQNISSPTYSGVWLKPGILKRKVVCYEITNNNGTPNDFSDDTTALVNTNWTVVGDGLISDQETQPITTCDQDSMDNWSGSTTIYGTDLVSGNETGGFRFCLGTTNSNNRLVRIFLYGHVITDDANNQALVNSMGFSRAEE